MKIKVGVSNRHVHLNEETYKKLFGDEPLNKKNDLVQPGEFSSDKVLKIITEKSTIENVRILGPFRSYNQVEISRTDAYKLGVDPSICRSGNLQKALPIIVENDGKRLLLDKSLIIANRHIHISNLDANELGIEDNKVVSLKVNGNKPGILKNVYFKVLDNANLEIHLDSDDANACLINQGDEVEIIDEV